MRRVVLLVLLAVACGTAAGCGGSTAAEQPSVAAQRDVARRFAEAILRGDAGAARSLLVHADDEVLSALVTSTAAPWRAHHGALRLPGARAGKWWAFRYTGTRTQRDGRFERLRGDIIVLVAASSRGAAVELFAFPNQHVRFSTHHDSVLLPSNR
jgi:hypothetical protein